MNQKKPILTDALYKGHSIPEVLDIYESMIKRNWRFKKYPTWNIYKPV